MLKFYRPLLPKAKSYVEPFFGGGALFAATTFASASINDINWELMDLYRWVKTDHRGIVKILKLLEQEYLSLNHATRKIFYYDLRKKYWTLAKGEIETSAVLFFLLKTGFNGIWQVCVASDGRFGTPCGLLNQDKSFIDTALIEAWAKKLQSTNIFCGEYSGVAIANRSFVFCDPPYRESFADYNTPFNDDKQLELLDWARMISAKTDSIVWISNRDGEDGFWDTNASDAKIWRFPVTYTAGRRKSVTTDGEETFHAKKAIEVLIAFGSN